MVSVGRLLDELGQVQRLAELLDQPELSLGIVDVLLLIGQPLGTQPGPALSRRPVR
jgi:hypothetical protein